MRASELDVPGLPTREQLREWMVEHDRIEKETEVFDSGELKKLKKFTKGEYALNASSVNGQAHQRGSCYTAESIASGYGSN